MNNNDQPSQRAIIAFLVALSLLSYARLYMLRDGYADDNCWLLAMYISDNLGDFLATGFLELRRVPQGIFVYLHLLPYRVLEDPYIVWHTIDLAVQITTPLVLYKFVRHLCHDAWLAAFVASALVIMPLDHVLPYLSSLNYRLGMLLGLISLYLTDAAAREGKWGWRLPIAMLLAVFAGHVLTEAAIGLEPARALLVWIRLHRAHRPSRETIVPVLRWLTPFALLGMTLVVYKLAFKPYGIYAGMYSTGLSRLFDAGAIHDVARLLAAGVWRYLRPLHGYAQWETVVLAVAAGCLALLFLLRGFRADAPAAAAGGAGWRHLLLAGLGIVMLAPVLFIFMYAGRPPRLGTESNHATLMQPGYAMLLGSIAHWIALRSYALGRRYFAAVVLALALMTGAGAYFNNLNLDMFRVATTWQNAFWSAFKQRFPTPPEGTDFVIDAEPPRYHRRVETFFQLEDIHANYELELGLNRLYEPGRLSGKRRYRVYPFEEMRDGYRSRGAAMFASKLERTTHFGTETLDFAQMTYVYWRGGQVFVNGEILKVNRAAIYRDPANKPLPGWATVLR